MPFIAEFTDDEDEAILVLAEELGGLVDFIGGYQYSHVLLEPLGALCCTYKICIVVLGL